MSFDVGRRGDLVLFWFFFDGQSKRERERSFSEDRGYTCSVDGILDEVRKISHSVCAMSLGPGKVAWSVSSCEGAIEKTGIEKRMPVLSDPIRTERSAPGISIHSAATRAP